MYVCMYVHTYIHTLLHMSVSKILCMHAAYLKYNTLNVELIAHGLSMPLSTYPICSERPVLLELHKVLSSSAVCYCITSIFLAPLTCRSEVLLPKAELLRRRIFLSQRNCLSCLIVQVHDFMLQLILYTSVTRIL